MNGKRLALRGVLLAFLSLAPTRLAAIVNVVYDANHTVTTGQLTLSIPQSWMQAGHAYTVTTRPVSGQTSAYGDPYIWSVTYDSRFIGKRVVYQSRNANDSIEQAHLQKDMWNAGEDRAEFWVRCEASASSCLMRVTVYEREAGTFDRKTFYREGVEYRVTDGQVTLNKNFYHSTRKNGDYGLQVSYEAGRYMYLYRSDNFDTGGANSLSLWIRTTGSIDEDDLSIVLTTGDHQLITNWLPLSDYVSIAQSNTWYRVVIPLSDLNPSGNSIHGLAIMSDVAGSISFDDVELTNAKFLWPLQGGFNPGLISTPFGANWSKSCGGLIKKHVGIDVPATVGAEVKSAMRGIVREIVTDPDFKQGVVVEDLTRSFTVVYWHINAAVSKGQEVFPGDRIGTIASMATTPHLHFGYRNGGYVEVALRGALPQQQGCEGDPAFPENFSDPATFSYSSW